MVISGDEIEEEDHVPLSKKSRKKGGSEMPPPKVVPASDPIMVTPISAVPVAEAVPSPSPAKIPGVMDKGKGVEVPDKDPSFVESSWEAPDVHSSHVRGSTQSEPWTPADARAKYVPNWGICQGDELTEPELCRAFMKMAFPPGERLRHARLTRRELSDRAAQSWVAAMAVMPEICKQWDESCEMVEDLKVKLAGHVGDAQVIHELAEANKRLDWKVKELDAAHAKDRRRFEAACERSNKELESRSNALQVGLSHSYVYCYLLRTYTHLPSCVDPTDCK